MQTGSVMLHQLSESVLESVTAISIDVFLDLLVYPTEDLPVHIDAGSTLTQSNSFKIAKEVFLYLSKKEKSLFLCLFNQKYR